MEAKNHLNSSSSKTPLYKCKNSLNCLHKFSLTVWSELALNWENSVLFWSCIKPAKRLLKLSIINNRNHVMSRVFWLLEVRIKLNKKSSLSSGLIEDPSSVISFLQDMDKRVCYLCFGLKLTCLSLRAAWLQILS